MNQVNDVYICTIKIGDRYRKEMGDLQALADSIEELGLLQPIGINPNYQLIWGERRLRAFELLGWDKIPARIVPMEQIILGEFVENAIRKDFTVSERVEIGTAVEDLLDGRVGSNQYQEKSSNELVQNFAQAQEGDKTRDIASKQAGFNNHTTFEQAKSVVETGSFLLIDAMDNKDASISAAAKIATLPPEEQDNI